MIVHIIVGGADYTPTPEDLDKIRDRFKAERVFVNDSTVKVLYAEGVPMNDESGLLGSVSLIVTAGTADWKPTEDELKALRKQFETAANEKNGLVVTRFGVSAEFLLHGDGFANACKIKFK